TIEQIVEAFLVPVIDSDITHMIPMMGRAMSSPDAFLFRVFKKHLAPVAERFRAAFAIALPDLSAAERMWRLLFIAGSMAYVLSWSHIVGEMTDGLCNAADRKDVTARLVRFVFRGFCASEETRVSR